MTRRAIQEFDAGDILARCAGLVVPWERLTKAEKLDSCASSISAFAGEVRDAICNPFFDTRGIFNDADVATLDALAEWVRFYARLEAWLEVPSNRRKEKVAQVYRKRGDVLPQAVREALASKPGAERNPAPLRDKPKDLPPGCPRLPSPDGGMVGWEELFAEFYANRVAMRSEVSDA